MRLRVAQSIFIALVLAMSLGLIYVVGKEFGVTFWFENYYTQKTIQEQEFYEKSKHFNPKICIEKNMDYAFYEQNYEKTYDKIISITQKLINETNSLKRKEIRHEITKHLKQNNALETDFEIKNNTIIENVAKIKALEKIVQQRIKFCDHNRSSCNDFYLDTRSGEGYVWALTKFYSSFSYCE